MLAPFPHPVCLQDPKVADFCRKLGENRQFWKQFWSKFWLWVSGAPQIFFWTTFYPKYLQNFLGVPNSNLKRLKKFRAPPNLYTIWGGGLSFKFWFRRCMFSHFSALLKLQRLSKNMVVFSVLSARFNSRILLAWSFKVAVFVADLPKLQFLLFLKTDADKTTSSYRTKVQKMGEQRFFQS